MGLIAFIGFVLRIVYLIRLRGRAIDGDGTYYHAIANLLADGHGFVNPPSFAAGVVIPSAPHPPLWPIVLGVSSWFGLRSNFQHQLIAALIGTMTVVATAYAARRVAGSRAGVVAACLLIVPTFFAREWELLAEPLAMLAVASVVLLGYRFIAHPRFRDALLVGVVVGALALTRSEFVLLVPMLVVPLVLSRSAVPWTRRWLWLAGSAAAFVALLAPWTVANNLRFREPFLLSTNFGVALVEANCDSTYSGERLGYGDGSCRRGLSENRLDETHDDSQREADLRRVGLRYVRENLGRVPMVVLAREGRAWNVFRPMQQIDFEANRGTPRSYVAAGFLVQWMLLGAATAGLAVLRSRRTVVWPLVIILVNVGIAIAATFGSGRFRSPADVPVVILAAVALDAVISMVERRQSARLPR